MWLRDKLYSKYILIGSLAVVALLGSAIGSVAFDLDHPIAWLLGIENGRFLHHPTAILYGVLVVVLSWRIVKLVSRLYRRIKWM